MGREFFLPFSASRNFGLKFDCVFHGNMEIEFGNFLGAITVVDLACLYREYLLDPESFRLRRPNYRMVDPNL